MKKYVCTLLLDQHDNYVYDDDTLPRRPLWDKELLTAFVKDERLSEAGYNMLPRSIAMLTTKSEYEPYPITIPEIDGLADIILVTRGKGQPKSGKIFRFDNFRRILAADNLEVWSRK